MGTPAPAGFTVKPVPHRTAGGLVGSATIGLILHVQAGNNSPYPWFQDVRSQASSTWWAGKRGGREQYGNPDTDKFWAQGAGNRQYHSIETEGYPGEALTTAQIEAVAEAYAFGHKRYGWPFQLAEKPGQPGLGWHGMGGSLWGGHYGCPGDQRRNQRRRILERAKQLAGLAPEVAAAPTPAPKEWDEMASKDEIRAVVREEIEKAWKADVIPSPMFKDNPTMARDTALRYGAAWALQARDRSIDIEQVCKAISAAMPKTGAVSDAQLEAALRKVLGSVDN